MVISRSGAPKFWVVLAILAIVSPAADAQVAIADLKAAFVLNLARFTEWPEYVRPAGTRVVLCVLGDRGVADSLGRIVTRKLITGRTIETRQPDDDASLRLCHVLYVNADAARARDLLATLADAPILTIGDSPAFTALGGTAHLFMEGDRMRFAVNVTAAHRANLRMSAQLLNMARIVRDDAAR